MCRITLNDVLHTACTHYGAMYAEIAVCHRLENGPEDDPELCPFLLEREASVDSWREGFCEDCIKVNRDGLREENVIDYDYCPKRLSISKHTLCGHTQRVYSMFRNCIHTRVRDKENEAPGGPPQYRNVCPLDIKVTHLKDSTKLCLQCQKDCDVIDVQLEPGNITNIEDEMESPFMSKTTGIPEIFAGPEDTTVFFAPGVTDPYEMPVNGRPFTDVNYSDSDSSSDDGSELFDHNDHVQREPDENKEVLDVRLGMLLHLDFTRDNTFQFSFVEGNLHHHADIGVTDDADDIDTPELSINGDSDTDDNTDIATPEWSDVDDDDVVPQNNTQAQVAHQTNEQTGNQNQNQNQNHIIQQEELEAVLRNTAIICGARVMYSGDFVLGDWVYDIIITGHMDLDYIVKRLEHVVNLDIPITIESIAIALASLRDSINEAAKAIRREFANHPRDATGFNFTLRQTYLDRIKEVEFMLPWMQQILGVDWG